MSQLFYVAILCIVGSAVNLALQLHPERRRTPLFAKSILWSASQETESSIIPDFLRESFHSEESTHDLLNESLFHATECDNVNRPPSLILLLNSLEELSTTPPTTTAGTEMCGHFVDHTRVGSIASVAHAIGRISDDLQPALTPLAAHCLGFGFASQLVLSEYGSGTESIEIVVGRDLRPHGVRLADAFARGAEQADPRIHVVYTGVTTSAACASFLRLGMSQAAVMVTARDMPMDWNGFQLYTNKALDMNQIQARAEACAEVWFSAGILPPSAGGVMCSRHVDYMPAYMELLEECVRKAAAVSQPLRGMKIVLNAGNGAGVFLKQVLENLGADLSGSLNLDQDGAVFPDGPHNLETVVQETRAACESVGADAGVILSFDAALSYLILPKSSRLSNDRDSVSHFFNEAVLGGNRLDALMTAVASGFNSESSPVTQETEFCSDNILNILKLVSLLARQYD